MDDIDKLEKINCAAFIIKNNVVNENQTPIEFKNHKFLIDPYLDETPLQAVQKAAQVGWSTLAIIRAVHLCRYRLANIIYTLPSKSVVKDFVSPKVDPLINSNPAIKSMIGQTDSTALKSIGNRFLYFRGSWEESAAISISAHILMNDEMDRSNSKVLNTYKSRLAAAKMDRPDMGWIWQFSNPRIPGAGVNEVYEHSDKKVWKIRCSRCNQWQTLSWPENINMKTEEYICKRCERPLSPEDRRKGVWVKTYQNRDISGYWLSQMMVPWITASSIIADSKGDQAVFHNFTLGLPYISKDQSVSRQDIIKCIAPNTNTRTNVAIGVDNGVLKHVVIGNSEGIFRVFDTESWDEIEEIRNRYDAYMVIDANPYPNIPKKLALKYKGKVFIHYYVEDKKQVGVIRWGEGDKRGVVESDRTKIIDAIVSDITATDIMFNLTITELEQYIYHWTNMFRVVEENLRGIRVANWKHIEGKPDHFAHATVYWKIALQRTLLHGGIIKPKYPVKLEDQHPTVSDNQTVGGLNLKETIQKVIKKTGRDWKHR